MATRREFFKQFFGQIGVLRDDIRGVENIPLNRLKELPKYIVEQIKPVFFPDVGWIIKEDKILIPPEKKSEKSISIKLNKIELLTIELFRKNIPLKQVAVEITEQFEFSYDVIYQTVTSLFFKLASLRICHPKEVYNIDEIIKSNKK